MDKLQVLQKLALEEGSSAKIFKAIADPPTTSLQRLKGLTTGGLPTFIDVGNSFGAPAITEDNLIHQLIKNGRRVIMMGDDTWLQVFPNHFHKAYPYPSFNVKDLHTVDNGVIEHMFPTLYQFDWDILIAHFLGVDHAGHIFGVESQPMIEKLEQYDDVLEKVVSILKNHSEPGGLHENTMLIVMGDHGQTLNGDHGGGTNEEVETSIFAMSMSTHAGSILSNLDTSDCRIAFDGRNDICIGSIPQLDFAVTMAALIGVPFPFGSVGRVNPELYGLVAGTWSEPNDVVDDNSSTCLKLQRWMEHYTDVMCINSWQVKRYIDAYSASSIIGFSPEDLTILEDIYNRSQATFLNFEEQQSSSKDEFDNGNCKLKMSGYQKQIDAYSEYLEVTAQLARAKWTQFGIKAMIIGFLLLLLSFIVHLTAALRLGKIIMVCSKKECTNLEACFPWRQLLVTGLCSTFLGIFCFPIAYSILEGMAFPQSVAALKEHILLLVLGTFAMGSAIGYMVQFKAGLYRHWKACSSICWIMLFSLENYKGISLRHMTAVSIVIMRAISFLSNSFILEEGRVANFLLASIGLLSLHSSIQNESMVPEAFLFLILNTILGIIGKNGASKEALMQPASDNYSFTSSDSVAKLFVIIAFAAVIVTLPVSRWLRHKHFLLDQYYLFALYIGGFISCLLILLHWILGDIALIHFVNMPTFVKDTARLMFPRIVYILTIGLTILLFSIQKSNLKEPTCYKQNTTVAVLAMLSVWSYTILLLLGKQGLLITLLAVLQGWCILKLQNSLSKKKESDGTKNDLTSDPLPIIQWNLFAVQLFFCTGHRCTFDGLRYGAAFIGFDNFNIIRQGILLALDTFGVSHILPIFGLPLLVTTKHSRVHDDKRQEIFLLHVIQVFLTYGLISVIMVIFSTICVTIQRRHLMVWGLFAPKYVFDIVGLLLTDTLVVLAVIYYT
ncbi:uncharacterized protein LOC131074124 isoform X2 [Cryptomeria japonica]|nr:uncharacterized protein LOC131074124 isoform X2 [Cryptomeria japonica]XP_059075596.1 uncharacterized protein LOC131074124 isoform X2 [Cryptomeria japonica]XP_059075597.1 uncharacterized protein LOC131074124 isoform X2 [Cryptomeria japonica]